MTTRRDFFKGVGALVVSYVTRQSVAQGQFGTHASHVDPAKLDSWIAVNADGTVTAYTASAISGKV
jgi:hypothetical protein